MNIINDLEKPALKLQCLVDQIGHQCQGPNAEHAQSTIKCLFQPENRTLVMLGENKKKIKENLITES